MCSLERSQLKRLVIHLKAHLSISGTGPSWAPSHLPADSTDKSSLRLIAPQTDLGRTILECDKLASSKVPDTRAIGPSQRCILGGLNLP